MNLQDKKKATLSQAASFCSTYGIRTRDSSVKGRRLNPLTNAPFPLKDRKDKGGKNCSQIFFKSFLKIIFSLFLYAQRLEAIPYQH